MCRPRAFAVDDASALRDFIRVHPFATIALAQEGDVLLAYAPVVLDDDGARRRGQDRRRGGDAPGK